MINVRIIQLAEHVPRGGKNVVFTSIGISAAPCDNDCDLLIQANAGEALSELLRHLNL